MCRNASKRAPVDSARKREGRENEEAIKRKRAEKKTDTKARKDRRNEAAENSLAVEREGDSLELNMLRSKSFTCYHTHNDDVFYAEEILRLETDNHQIRSKLAHRDEQDIAKPIKLIPPPEN
jgi:hypothetical protein